MCLTGSSVGRHLWHKSDLPGDTCLTCDFSVAGQERFFDDVSERYAGFDYHPFYSTPLLQMHVGLDTQ